MRFNINLSPQPAFDSRTVNLLCNISLILISCILALNGLNFIRTNSELDRIEQQLKTLAKNSSTSAPAEKDLNGLKTRIEFANRLISQKAKNPLALLDNLEEVTPEGVMLTTLQPADKEGVLKLDGIAGSFSLIQTYLNKLHESGRFRDPLLLSQAPDNNLNQGIAFSISCKVVDL